MWWWLMVSKKEGVSLSEATLERDGPDPTCVILHNYDRILELRPRDHLFALAFGPALGDSTLALLVPLPLPPRPRAGPSSRLDSGREDVDTSAAAGRAADDGSDFFPTPSASAAAARASRSAFNSRQASAAPRIIMESGLA